MQIPVEIFLGGLASILTAVVGAGIRKVWVWGYQLADMEEDRNLWRGIALKSMNHTDQALAVAKRAKRVEGG